MKSYDVVIVGGGPAGLSAALVLGRSLRKTLLLDGDVRRNLRAAELHNFITRDGIPPAEFRAIARSQLTTYETVEARDGKVSRVEKIAEGFEVHIEGEATPVRTRRVLLATGVRDEPPAIPGLDAQWGHTSFQCPYCHGWELRGRPWGVLITSDMLGELALLVLNWSSGVTAFTQGLELGHEIVGRMQAAGIVIEKEPIAKVLGTHEAMEGVELQSGRVVTCGALVIHPPQRPVDLVIALGLELEPTGFVRVDPRTKESSVPGIHVAGDATTMMQTAISAAAEGTMAGAMMNHILVAENVARGVLPSTR